MSSSIHNSVIVRLKLSSHVGVLSSVTAAISDEDADIGAIDIIRADAGSIVRDITFNTSGPDHAEKIKKRLEGLEGVEVVHLSDRTFLMHLGGKIEVTGRINLKNRDELSMAYTPGVARICMAIYDDPKKVHNLTMKRNMIAIVTDGSAVLGLGNIGPAASLPVMEGKALLFKDFADVNAFPICLDTQDTEEIIKAVKQLAVGFGGINLEDISAPRCFEIEDRLKAELDIPVFHDDQHGTAVVLAAGFINSLKIVNKKAKKLKVVISGAGAAGVACAKMLQNLGVVNIIACDSKGALVTSRSDLNSSKRSFAETTNPNQEGGTLSDVMRGADVFVGVSAPNILSVQDLKNMKKDPIVFAMANPDPEIAPEIACEHVAIMATGRSDHPNQINNALAFPGIFRGALNCHASDINEAMKTAAAYAIAGVVEDENLSRDYIVPSVFDPRVVPAIAEAVEKAARESGVATK